MTMSNLLEVKNLSVVFHTDFGDVHAVRDASFEVGRGEIYGVVGESGSGKSVTTKAVMRINPPNGEVVAGEIAFDDRDILSLPEADFRAYRGRRISTIFQDSLSALNPVYTVGSKLVELLTRLQDISKRDARQRALELLQKVGITEPERCFKSYPHELSGGMRQRVMIAMAISCDPELVIADEPTTALDVTIQAQILHLIRDISRSRGMSVILITHDLGVVAQLCGRASVMCGGYVVETGDIRDIFHGAAHPYTRALIASMPRVDRPFESFLERERERETSERALCPFLERCAEAREVCREILPEMMWLSGRHCARCWRLMERE